MQCSRSNYIYSEMTGIHPVLYWLRVNAIEWPRHRLGGLALIQRHIDIEPESTFQMKECDWQVYRSKEPAVSQEADFHCNM